jgi:hypothetical protein
MEYRFQTLRTTFRYLAPTLQATQHKSGTPQCILLPAAHTGRRTATVADPKRGTTAQALAELSATVQPRELLADINAVNSGFEALGGDMGNIHSDWDPSVAGLDAKVAVLDTAFRTFRNLQLRKTKGSSKPYLPSRKGLDYGSRVSTRPGCSGCSQPGVIQTRSRAHRSLEN